MTLQYRCPGCLGPQDLDEAVVAPSGSRGLLVSCPDCETVAGLYVSGVEGRLWQIRAQVRVEKQVREFREALEADEVPSWLT